ncbi:hypothetical protein LMH87_004212 [Akanthomyces muscarius]|uniref:Zn(2)-C6 fungal-type domain-containing protein n=1 Tax=Akanthomyces muscarius TaxID=2231603 RepID=A0A9W8Q464_AKAMU|nr:hypothetical protein LMH87_004212 [Akanthomyces muscarius]KAJ4145360.1 hypothetical protein LMH87_004212 [Akanthomyces muscarius]
MVFSGRPSTACHACRPARRKCDRAPEGCSQCRRKGQECPGYPDPTALRMRNETTRVTQKQASKSKALTKQQRPPRQESTSSSPSYSVQEADSPSSLQSFASFGSCASPSAISVPLSPDTDQQSISFLFNTFISATPFEPYLASYYAPDSPRDDACAWAIDATALAAYARHSRQLHNQDEAARIKYAGALTRVNAALADPQAAVEDRTLVAVLVLALFEATMFQASSAPTSWLAHTWGAMQLLLLRGAGQVASPAARLLFAHTSNNVKATCIQRSIAIPRHFLALDQQVRGLLDSHDPAVRLANLLHRVSNIKAKSREQEPNLALLLEAIEVDQEIVQLCDNPPSSLGYTREPLACGPAWTYKRIVHTYPNLRLCKVWNSVRLLRILLLSFLGDDIAHFRLDEIHADPQTLSGLNEYARKHMAEVAADVLATIPSFVHEENSVKTFYSPGRRKPAIDPERHPGSREDWLHLFHFG